MLHLVDAALLAQNLERVIDRQATSPQIPVEELAKGPSPAEPTPTLSAGPPKMAHSPINLRPVYGDLSTFLKQKWSPYKAEDEAVKLVGNKVVNTLKTKILISQHNHFKGRNQWNWASQT